VSSTSINFILNKASNEDPFTRASGPIDAPSYNTLFPANFPPDLRQACSFSSAATSKNDAAGNQTDFTATPSYETQTLLAASFEAPIANSHRDNTSRVELNTTSDHNQASQTESDTSHLGLAQPSSAFVGTTSTWDILDQIPGTSSNSSTQDALFAGRQKEDGVQFQSWLYETSNTNINSAERIEKVKWETKSCEKL
jgi:hypothetical protein